MRLLITGGAGSIGSRHVRHVLATTDHAVTVCDALTDAGDPTTLRDVDDDPRSHFVSGAFARRGARGDRRLHRYDRWWWEPLRARR